ncbi:MAG: HAD-IB family hydrolase [Magnetococcales bacterium]|nr:HAD-IB family hydrolase [Magnetococcales bacterium]
MLENQQDHLAVFDLDKTITSCDTFRIFLRHVLLRRPGRWGRVPWLLWATLMYKAGWRSNSWLKGQFFRHVAGHLPRATLQRRIDATVAELIRVWLKPGAVAKLTQHRNAAHRLILATASLDLYVIPLAEQLGIQEVVCTRTDWNSPEIFTGMLTSPNCYGPDKLVALEHHLGKQLATCQAAVYSDHQADLSILMAAKDPVAVDPTPALQKMALAQGWTIVHWR